MDLEADRARYLADREEDVRLSGTGRHRRGHDKRERLDALLFAGLELAQRLRPSRAIRP